MKKTLRNGFTLIELVVVIMILGILAGVAAPKLLSVSGDAKDNGLKQTLSIIRDAIELYAAEHGSLPPCTGTGVTAGADFRTAIEPFIRGSFPDCPVGTTNNGIIATGIGTTEADASPVTGWKYNTADGTFICNSSANDGSGVAYDEL